MNRRLTKCSLTSDSQVNRSAEGSRAETLAMLSAGEAVRSARLAAEDMVSVDQAAEIAKTSHATICEWIEEGRCIGLSQVKGGFRVPRWQFESRIWPLISQIAAGLGTTEGWALLTFLETPHGALGGVAPRLAIEHGQGKRVLDISVHDGN